MVKKNDRLTAPTGYAGLLSILASRRTSVHLTLRTAAQPVAAKRYK
jgi:hypothetical protein